MIVLLSIPFGLLFTALAILCIRHRQPLHALIFCVLAGLSLATGAVSALLSYWLANAI
jgi:NADH:ubiquinone oxidoreductase subunit 6 (subunit J)